MNNKDLIIETTINLIEKEKLDVSQITIREISKRCNIAVGLINYHFKSKEELINISAERIINSIIYKFEDIKVNVAKMKPFEALDFLGNLTLDYLFDHYQIARISILSDISNPKIGDNTFKTYISYLPLISKIHPEYNEEKVKIVSLKLIFFMQQIFIRNDIAKEELGIDLFNKEERHKFHHAMIKEILEV